MSARHEKSNPNTAEEPKRPKKQPKQKGPKSRRGPIVPLTIFTIVMLVILAGLFVVFSEYRSGSSSEYKAMFSDVSKLEKGDKVRMAGVEVGRIKGVDLVDGNLAEVSFTVDSDQIVYTDTSAVVRYQNLTGDRYMALEHKSGEKKTLDGGGTIPLENTEPALDLDALLGGFKPLLKALDPGQVNQLTSAIISVFQGESGNVAQLLAATNSLTNTLANRDELIGSVIDNLNVVLGTVADNKEHVDSMVDDLQQLISGLSKDAEPIAQSVERLSTAGQSMSDLIADVRPPLQQSLSEGNRLAGNINDDEPFVENVINRLSSDFEKMLRLGAYGSFFNFYLCGVLIRFTGPDGKTMYMPQYEQKTGRCSM